MIIHIPHASTLIPKEHRAGFVQAKLKHEIAVMTDWYCDELFEHDAPTLAFPVSRLVCDPERFREDSEEIMSAIGMGAVYTRSSDGTPLRTVTAAEREMILRKYYDSHHEALERMVQTELERSRHALILDGHSFHMTPLPYETSTERPDFCIGTDDYHTPRPLAEDLIAFFRSRGFSVLENAPFAGSIVPLRYWQKDPRVHSVMIEVNRGLYLKNGTDRSERFAAVRAVLRDAMTLLRSTEPTL